jgi:ketosteroid isomerase-like protein
MAEEPIELVRRYHEAVAAGDREAIFGLLRWFQVQTVRDGQIVRWEMFLDPEAARRAAGLAE